MVLGISRRDRHAIRADKVWKSPYHRQLLELNRGLTDNKIYVTTIDQGQPKPFTEIPRTLKENTNAVSNKHS